MFVVPELGGTELDAERLEEELLPPMGERTGCQPLAHGDIQPQLFIELPAQALSRGLTGIHLPAGELPAPAVDAARLAPCKQHTPVSPGYARNGSSHRPPTDLEKEDPMQQEVQYTDEDTDGPEDGAVLAENVVQGIDEW